MKIIEKKEEKIILIPVESVVDTKGEKIENLAEMLDYEGIDEFAPLLNIDNIDPSDFRWFYFGACDEIEQEHVFGPTYIYYGGINYKDKYYGSFSFDEADGDNKVNPDTINIDGIDYYEFKEAKKKEVITRKIKIKWDFS